MIIKKEYLIIAGLIFLIMLLVWFGNGYRKTAHIKEMQNSVLKSSLEAKTKYLIEEKNKTNALEAAVEIEKEKVLIAEKEVDRLKKRRTITKAVVPVTKNDSLKYYVDNLSVCDSSGVAKDTLISALNRENLAKEDVIISLSSQVAIYESIIYDQNQYREELKKKFDEAVDMAKKKTTWNNIWKGLCAGLALTVTVLAVAIGL